MVHLCHFVHAVYVTQWVVDETQTMAPATTQWDRKTVTFPCHLFLIRYTKKVIATHTHYMLFDSNGPVLSVWQQEDKTPLLGWWLWGSDWIFGSNVIEDVKSKVERILSVAIIQTAFFLVTTVAHVCYSLAFSLGCNSHHCGLCLSQQWDSNNVSVTRCCSHVRMVVKSVAMIDVRVMSMQWDWSEEFHFVSCRAFPPQWLLDILFQSVGGKYIVVFEGALESDMLPVVLSSGQCQSLLYTQELIWQG